MSKLTDAPNFFIGRSEAIAQNDKLSNKARQSLYTARAANTVDAYRSDWNDFCDWCSYHQLSSFPAEPETIVNYINDLADNAKANTIARRISALTENFDAAGLKENPCRYPIVKNALRGIKRMKGTIQHGKAPILYVFSRCCHAASPAVVGLARGCLLPFRAAFTFREPNDT